MKNIQDIINDYTERMKVARNESNERMKVVQYYMRLADVDSVSVLHNRVIDYALGKTTVKDTKSLLMADQLLATVYEPIEQIRKEYSQQMRAYSNQLTVA